MIENVIKWHLDGDSQQYTNSLTNLYRVEIIAIINQERLDL